MRKPPEAFVERLDRLFDHRLRIRWSNQRQEWHIEYKVARGKQMNFFVSEWDDGAVRARDGYAFVLAIRTGDRMPCPRCGMEVKVPIFKIGEAKCDYCTMQGKNGFITAAFFPLEGDALMTHLIKFDPLRTYRDDLVKRADEANARLEEQKERAFASEVESLTNESYRQLVGIPSVGYTTGKVFTGE